MKEPFVSRMLKIALYAIFAAGAAITVSLPFALDRYFLFFLDAYFSEPGYRMFILCFLMVTSAAALWIVVEMILMLRSIPKGPFTLRNVRALNRIGFILFGLALLFFGKCVRFTTPLTLCGGALFVVAGLFAFTLANLIRQAAVFKEENDLTI